MSDFIDRLAARVVGTAPALTPRLPALFEPAPRASIIAPDEGAAEPSERGEPRSVTPAPMQAQHSSRQPTMEPAAASQVTAGERVAPERAAAMAATAPPVAPHPSSSAAVRGSAPATERAGLLPLPPLPSTAEPVALAMAATARRVGREPALQGSRSKAEAATLLAPVAPMLSSRRVSQAGAEYARAGQTAGRIAQAANARPDDGGRVAEPVIHVSIGRLEVRAAAGPASPPRRHEPAAPSRLDDYLRLRGDKVVP